MNYHSGKTILIDFNSNNMAAVTWHLDIVLKFYPLESIFIKESHINITSDIQATMVTVKDRKPKTLYLLSFSICGQYKKKKNTIYFTFQLNKVVCNITII